MNWKLCTLVTLLLAGVVAPESMANGGECTSAAFRDAFLAGQQDIPFDHLDISSTLLAMGDDVLPCLQTIAENGGDDYGITGCIEGPHGCQVWAVRAIAELRTPDATQYLVDYLDDAPGSRPLVTAINMLRIQGVRESRSALLRLLAHPDPGVRTASIVALGAIGDRSDFEAMLEATVSLPDEFVYKGSQAFEIWGDPRAIEPLKKRARSISAPIERRAVEGRIQRIREKAEGAD